MWLLRTAIYWVCQCIGTRKTAKRKAESKWRAVKMPEKKRNQLVKTICHNKGVTSVKLAEKMNADRSFVGRFVREATVRTYKRIRRPQLKPRLEQRQKTECGKNKAETPILCHTGREMDPLAFPQLHPIEDFWVLLKQEVDKDGWNPKMKTFWQVLSLPYLTKPSGETLWKMSLVFLYLLIKCLQSQQPRFWEGLGSVFTILAGMPSEAWSCRRRPTRESLRTSRF